MTLTIKRVILRLVCVCAPNIFDISFTYFYTTTLRLNSTGQQEGKNYDVIDDKRDISCGVVEMGKF